MAFSANVRYISRYYIAQFGHGPRIVSCWKEIMSKDRKILSVMFRTPQFPVIVFTGTQTLAAKTAAELYDLLMNLPRLKLFAPYQDY